jgi:hypothetical protein
MSQGILGWIHNNISGDQSRPTPSPGIFGKGTVGEGWGNYLKGLYATDTGNTAIFKSQSSALRDALSMEAEGQKDEFGLAANAGGFYDSGARLTGLNEINRNKIASYSQGLAAILAKLESDKMAAAFPYLQAQLGEYTAHQTAIGKAQDEQNFRGAQLGAGISGAFSGGGGGGTG